MSSTTPKNRKILLLTAAAVLLTAVGGVWLQMELEARKWSREFSRTKAQASTQSRADNAGKSLTLIEAAGLGRVSAEMTGPAEGPLQLGLANLTSNVLAVDVPGGQIFLSQDQDAELISLEPVRLVLKPGEKKSVELAAVAGSVLNAPGEKTWLVSLRRDARLQPLVTHLSGLATLPKREVLQAAVLIGRENLPLAALAKFKLLTQDRPADLARESLKLQTEDLVQALILLEDAGYAREEFAILIDPQFQLEAMLDPAARPFAAKLFQIVGKQEWVFWKNQLENGHNNIRHRALLGIGRYYPDVAMKMLPDWARFENISIRFRQAALQGLAEMGTPEAGALLNKLRWEFREGHILETSANQALAMHDRYRQNPLVPRPTRQERPQLNPDAAPAQVALAKVDEPAAAAAEIPAEPPLEAAPETTPEEEVFDLVALAEMYAKGEDPALVEESSATEPEELASAAPATDSPIESTSEESDEMDLVAFAEALAGGGDLPETAEQFLADNSDGSSNTVTVALEDADSLEIVEPAIAASPLPTHEAGLFSEFSTTAHALQHFQQNLILPGLVPSPARGLPFLPGVLQPQDLEFWPNPLPAILPRSSSTSLTGAAGVDPEKS